MTPNQIFSIVNTIALASWILLALLPRRGWIRMLTGGAIPVLLAVAYSGIVAAQWHNSSGGFSSLADVLTLFGNPWMLLAGWTHYLAFDLLVGNWEVRDSQERGISHLVVRPCLVLTFLFGPAGWLLYLTIRAAHAQMRVRPA